MINFGSRKLECGLGVVPSRSHALRGNARVSRSAERDSLRSASLEACRRAATHGVPTQSVGTSCISLRTTCVRAGHAFCRNPLFPVPKGLTLIELLVVIVILTTLVGGVIPVLSPNNDTRKIRAAARGLQGYITQVQAQAARTGRPHGIGFIENSAESGAALEVFGLEVPPPFAGFSTSSRVRIIEEQQPTPTNGQRTNLIYYLQFITADVRDMNEVPLDAFPPDDYPRDFMPPNFLSLNDVIEINENRFPLVHNNGLLAETFDENGFYNEIDKSLFLCGYYLRSDRGAGYTSLDGSPLAFVERYEVGGNTYRVTAPLHYKIRRQPTNSSEAPYQLPSSIAIDMQGSIVEGSESAVVNYPRFPTDVSLFTNRSSIPDGDPIPIDSVGIMFSPTGAVDRLILNGNTATNYSRIVLLLGRIENAGIDPDVDNTPRPWVFQDPSDKEELENKQETINWLSPDSRLVSIVPSNGRVVVSEPAFVDPSLLTPNENDAEEQIEAAHGFAHEMTTVGSN